MWETRALCLCRRRLKKDNLFGYLLYPTARHISPETAIGGRRRVGTACRRLPPPKKKDKKGAFTIPPPPPLGLARELPKLSPGLPKNSF